MQDDYQLDDLTSQNADWVIYRVLGKDGSPFMLTRLRYDPGDVSALMKDGVFHLALEELKNLRHEVVRPVVDGGLDEVDHYPWVVSQWFDGKPLSSCKISLTDIKNIGAQLEAVVEDLGRKADVLNFEADEILTIRTPDDFLHVLFTIDYHCWFRDLARGLPPGSGRDAAREVRRLLEGLVDMQERRSQKPTDTPIPLVEERSPALVEYKPPRERYFGKFLVVLALAACLAAIVWVTLQGQEKANRVESLDRELEQQAAGN